MSSDDDTTAKRRAGTAAAILARRTAKKTAGATAPTRPREAARQGALDLAAPSASPPADEAETTPGPVTIYTDGACSGNPGPGGWGAILLGPDAERELSGGEAMTTNNRMELMAAIMALEALQRPRAVALFTDSQYVRNGITAWMRNWKARGWRTADNKPVKNEDLWRRLDAARARHKVEWHWVKGHASDPLNHRVDALAVAAMGPFKRRR